MAQLYPNGPASQVGGGGEVDSMLMSGVEIFRVFWKDELVLWKMNGE